MSKNSERYWPYLAVVSTASFCLNWLWEMAQMSTYVEMAGRPWLDTIPTCTIASLGDAAMTLGIYGLGSLAAGDPKWGLTPRWNVYAAAALLGAACAVGIEWKAMAWGRWSYAERMPIVPIAGVGLWPLLQLTLLVPAVFWVGTWWTRRTDESA